MSGKWQGGKGSDPRPIADRKKFEDNWDRIFGKKPEEPKEPEKAPTTIVVAMPWIR